MSREAHRLHVGDMWLEARMFRKETGTLGVIILHPYPLLGGFLYDPVVSAVYRLAKLAPEVNTVVRYNQRGVGQSGGSKSFWGYRDCQDLSVICKYLLALPNGPQSLYVVGYSFGACIAAHAADLPHVAGYVGISPPLEYLYGCIKETQKRLEAEPGGSLGGGMAGIALRAGSHLALLEAAPIPKLIVFGDMDQFASAAAARAFAERHNARCKQMPLSPAQGSAVPPCLPSGRCLSSAIDLKVFPDCDHFWVEEKAVVAEHVMTWILDTARLWAGQAGPAQASC